MRVMQYRPLQKMGPHHLMDLVLLMLFAFIENKLYLPNELAIIIKLISTLMNNLEHIQVKQCLYVNDSLHKTLMMMMMYIGWKSYQETGFLLGGTGLHLEK